MPICSTQKNIARELRKEWQALGLQSVALHETAECVILKAVIAPFSSSIKTADIHAAVTAGLARENSSHVSIGMVLCQSVIVDEKLPVLCSFFHQCNVHLSPLSLIADLNDRVILLRCSLLVAGCSLLSRHFMDISKRLAPLLQQGIRQLETNDYSIEEARLTADYLMENYCLMENNHAGTMK